jgi:RHS repeat-associated protein
VFFDNLQVVHARGPLLEETHYYPFGLTMAGISSKAAGKLENRIKFNSMELQSSEFGDGVGLEMYEYKYRFYDHQIGRFISQDGLADKYPYYAPYQFAGNEPTRAIDLDGLEPAYFNQTGTDRFGLPIGREMPAGDNLRRPIENRESFTKWVGKPSPGDFKQGMIGLAGAGAIALSPLLIEGAGAAWVTYAPEISAFQGIEATSTAFGVAGGAAGSAAAYEMTTAEGAAAKSTGTVYERVMSDAELKATQSTNLLRGGREGENFFSLKGTISSDAKRAQQRLGLDGTLRTQKVEFSLKNYSQIVNGPRVAKAGQTGTAGGGTEYSTNQATEISIKKIIPLKNTGQ